MVELAPRLVFGPEHAELQEGINLQRIRNERAERARSAMREHGVPALLATGRQNMRYLTGYIDSAWQPGMSYTLFFAEHDPIIFAHAGSYHQMPDLAPWIDEWRIGRCWFTGIAGREATQQEASEWAQEIRDELAKKDLLGEPLGVIDYDTVAQAALAEQGIHAVDGGPILLQASQVKTHDEINCLRMIATISSAGLHAGVQTITPGVRQSEVTKQMTDALKRGGADVASAACFSGPLAFERMVSPADRIIEHGDIGYIFTCGSTYMGYMCCIYRSFVLGRQPSSKERGWYDATRDQLDAVMEAIKPGATTADAAKHFEPASKWNYKHEAEVLTVQYGHGTGLVSLGSMWGHYNPPNINRQWSLQYPQVFEEGMVIAVEALEGEHRVGGMRLENMVVVTDDGCQLLDSYPREEAMVIGM